MEGQRAPALRFPDSRVQALFSALILFKLLPHGFSNKTLREQLATLLGQSPEHFSQGRMTYDLRRLRLHGLIERIPKTHRYRVTSLGLQISLFFTRTYARVFAPRVVQYPVPNIGGPLRRAFDAGGFGRSPSSSRRLKSHLKNLTHSLQLWNHKTFNAGRIFDKVPTRVWKKW